MASASALGSFDLDGGHGQVVQHRLIGEQVEMLEDHAHLLTVEGQVHLLPVMSTPSKMIEPEVGVSSRFRLRRNVLLPPPDGPMTAMTSPLQMSTVTPSRALTSPPL